ncbi:helix-turn-helix domain-containing protein [Paraconexibacter antarcticus]|uniref:helix-turn-helix domain-containing protein n=1 Tax=Paraconexibacter antarcticus TaxID=2949664 RepID=UPI00346124D3
MRPARTRRRRRPATSTTWPASSSVGEGVSRCVARATVFSPQTREAAGLLGAQIAAARLARRWTVDELAERVGVSHPTIRKAERGDPTVGLGVAFEAATVLGVPLFSADPERRSLEVARFQDRLTVLPSRARRPTTVPNDF